MNYLRIVYFKIIGQIPRIREFKKRGNVRTIYLAAISQASEERTQT